MAETKKAVSRKKKKRATDNPVFLKIQKQNEKFQSIGAEVTKQFREFNVPGEEGMRIFRVYFPSPDIESSVNRTYTKVYGKLLQDEDCLPEQQILEMMKKRGVWSDANEGQIKDLQERLARLRNLIYFSGIDDKITNAEMDKTADDYETTENSLNELLETRNSFTSNSIETRAYETKIQDQVWQCVKLVVDGNEQPVWNSLEEIGGELDRLLLYRVINECVTFWQGVPSGFLEDLPETQDGENGTQ